MPQAPQRPYHIWGRTVVQSESIDELPQPQGALESTNLFHGGRTCPAAVDGVPELCPDFGQRLEQLRFALASISNHFAQVVQV